MKYPEEVLTKDKKGNLEVRNIISKGKFVLYDYRHSKTFKQLENKKLKLYLKDKERNRGFYLIPLKGSRYLMIEAKQDKHPDRKVWNQKKRKPEGLF
ncbi:MAG: hypothetical protein J4452_00590 [Candidatus Aenigmarchaeota archaeon]|nr:hypothetical protein [Candidatus Aenigmarchaeota archaeon]